MTPKFTDYLTKQMRKYMTVVVIGTTVFFMVLSIGAAQLYTHYRLNNDNQTIKNIVNEDYQSLSTIIEEIEDINKDSMDFLELVTRKMYDLRSRSTIKFNFTILNDELNVLLTNLYPQNQKRLLESDELKSALRQLETLESARIVDNGIKGYVGQEAIMIMLIKTDDFYYLIEPLHDSFIDLEHKISSNLIISDRYDNILFDNSLRFSDSLNKVSIDLNDHAVVLDTVELYTIRTVKEKILPASLLVYTILVIAMMLLVLIQLLKPLARRLAKTLDAPLDELLAAIEINKNGNLDHYIEIHHFEEFDIIYSEFNDLMRSTKQLMLKNEDLIETKRQIEIKHLKNQFNPHFIYNALESIRYEIMFHPENASDMILSLGRLMQYSIENIDTLVDVSEDIKYLEDYLKLQKMRFKDRLTYSIDIEESLRAIKMPKLMIQPIIENSIKHNMEQVESLNLEIKGMIIAKNIYFVVKDNGLGIKSRDLAIIRESLEHQTVNRNNLGLYNINRTIKLMYGNEYGIALENDEGLRVIVNLPIEDDEL